MSKYYLYIDECGDHNLKTYDPVFPIFTLCGILMTRENRKSLFKSFEDLKKDFFRTTDIIIHSVDIRKWRGVFSILRDDDIRVRFYAGIERILKQHGAYVIVSCTILKEQLTKFCVRGEEEDVYGLSLAYLLERSVFYVDNQIDENPDISVVVERRGKKEDKKLLDYYNHLRNTGTKWVKAERLTGRVDSFTFKSKQDNVVGLQIADLIAYPITQHFLHPERENRSYDVVKHNIFADNGRLLGQKVIPH